MKNLRKKLNKKGFTLIELIIVIAILGILATIAIPRFFGFTENAKIAADEEYAEIVAQGAILYYAAESAVPSVASLISEDYIESYVGQSTEYGESAATYTVTSALAGSGYTIQAVLAGGGNTYTVLK